MHIENIINSFTIVNNINLHWYNVNIIILISIYLIVVLSLLYYIISQTN